MIKTITAILKKHLDDGYREEEKEVEMTIYSPWDILCPRPDYLELRGLAKELFTTIRGQDLSELIKLPDESILAAFLKPHVWFVGEDEEFGQVRAMDLSRELLYFLKYGTKKVYYYY